MRVATSLARWALTAVLATSVGMLDAQDTGFSKDFKIRAGYAPSTKDNLRAYASGFGLNLEYGVGVGRIGLELGYFYKTGDQYATTPSASLLPGTLNLMNAEKSHETKRNQLDGFTVRLAFNQALMEGWRWQAGVQLGSRFKHQYVGDAQSTDWGASWDGGVNLSKSWRDLYNGTPEESGLNPSPYAGVTWNIDKTSSLEFNVVLLNYKAIEYNHFAGTASAYDPQQGYPVVGRVSSLSATWPNDTLTSKTRMVPHLEIAYVFHF
jgi:hypothetical protein